MMLRPGHWRSTFNQPLLPTAMTFDWRCPIYTMNIYIYIIYIQYTHMHTSITCIPINMYIYTMCVHSVKRDTLISPYVVYVYIYVCYIYIPILYVHVCMYVCMYVCIHICIYIYICIYIHIYVFIYICKSVCYSVYVYVIYTHILYIRLYTYI